MMDHVIRANEEDPKITIRLGGAAIGNGWIDPFHQYAAAPAAYASGLIDLSQWSALNQKELQCQESLLRGVYDDNKCFRLLDDVIDASAGNNGNLKISMYDDRVWEKKGAPRSYPSGHQILEAYLGNLPKNPHKKEASVEPPHRDLPPGIAAEVLRSIHAEAAAEAGQYYRECTDPAYMALADQDGLGVTHEIARILDAGIPMLFFNGMNDLMCNHVGNEKALEDLPWSRVRQFALAERYAWRAPSQEAQGVTGYVKAHRNLIFLKWKDAGHMVPVDRPRESLDMMKIFLKGGSFNQKAQKGLDRAWTGDADCPVTLHARGESGRRDNRQVYAPYRFHMIFISRTWMGVILAFSLFVYHQWPSIRSTLF